MRAPGPPAANGTLNHVFPRTRATRRAPCASSVPRPSRLTMAATASAPRSRATTWWVPGAAIRTNGAVSICSARGSTCAPRRARSRTAGGPVQRRQAPSNREALIPTFSLLLGAARDVAGSIAAVGQSTARRATRSPARPGAGRTCSQTPSTCASSESIGPRCETALAPGAAPPAPSPSATPALFTSLSCALHAEARRAPVSAGARGQGDASRAARVAGRERSCAHRTELGRGGTPQSAPSIRPCPPSSLQRTCASQPPPRRQTPPLEPPLCPSSPSTRGSRPPAHPP